MPSELLDWLQRSALAATLAIVVVLCLRRLWLRWLGARSVLWLWLLVPALVIAVTVPARVVQLTVASPAPATPVAPRVLYAIASPQPPALSTQAQSWTSRTTKFFEAQAAAIEVLLIATWLLGAMLLALRLLLQQRDFLRRLGALQPRADGSWIARSSDFGPVVVGLLKPRIVVPADFEFRYDARQRGLILAHERCHLRRGDLRVNFLLCVLRCVYWFNPLVHLAARRLRFDQELACDAAVLAHFPHSRRAYADAILNTQLADLGLPVGCYWQSSHPLKWRIIMLTKPTAGLARVMLGSVLAIAGSTLAAVSAWAALPRHVEAQPVLTVLASTEVPATQPAIAAKPALAAQPGFASTQPARATTPIPAVDSASVVVQPTPATEATPVVQPSPATEATPVAAPAPAIQPAPAVEATPAAAPTPAPSVRPRPATTPVATTRPTFAALDAAGTKTVVNIARGALQATTATSPAFADVSVAASPEAVVDEITLPILLKIDEPRFPRSVGRMLPNRSGQVVVSVELDEQGNPLDVSVADSNLSKAFEKSALRAVRNGHYAPAKKNGVAVSCTALVPVVFTQDTLLTGRELYPLVPPQMHKPRNPFPASDRY